MYHSFLIHSSADGDLGCFHVLAIVNSVVMNIGMHVSPSDMVSSVCMPRSGIAVLPAILIPACASSSPAFLMMYSAYKLNKVKSLSRVQLYCDPMGYSLPGSSIHGIFQARILEWVAISFSQSDGGTGKFVLRSRVIIMKAGRYGEQCGDSLKNWK